MDAITKPPVPPKPRRPRTYASPDMSARRDRILREALHLLIEGGETALTIAALCDRADVAPRTVYRAFNDRDGVIVAAIEQHMEALHQFLSQSPPEGDIPSIMREYDWMAAEALRRRELARVLTFFYFSASATPQAIDSLGSVARTRVRAWFAYAREHGQLVDAFDQERLERFLADTEYVTYRHWAAGTLADRDLADAIKANFLRLAIMCTRDPVRSELIGQMYDLESRLSR